MGTSTPSKCPAGSYMDQEGNSDPDCFPCPGGKYCGVGDETGGEDCDPGYFCTTKNTKPNPESVQLPFLISLSLVACPLAY